MNKPIILSIAGSDPSGGAGIQTDIRTADRIGVYPCTAITALTVQNSRGVTAVEAVDREILEKQIVAVLDDCRPDAVKIGLIPTLDCLSSIVEIIKFYKLSNIVVDPVLSPTLGSEFAKEDMSEAMTNRLFPLATLITPNIPEAERLGIGVNDNKYRAVLFKDGHGDGEEITDTLVIKEDGISQKKVEFNHPRIHTPNTHGSGCVLSTAIASYLALGADLENAVKHAIIVVDDAMNRGKNIEFGKGGYGPTLF